MLSFHDHIIPIPTAYANSYLIKSGNISILIDTGLQRSGKIILKGIAEAGLQPSDIRLIILTHCHYDHCRGARAIQAATGAEMLAHRDDRQKIQRGYCRLPKGTNFPINAWVSMGRIFMPWLAYFPAAEPSIVIHDDYIVEDTVPDIRIIHTPGHTEGSITVILEGRHAIVGDTAVGHTRTPFPPFAEDPRALLLSWKKLLEMGIEYIYPGHGIPYRAERLKKDFEKRRGNYNL
jgi:glyoxylase-like metal-dependent hydrolase (beta-lactamase superfamily II)